MNWTALLTALIGLLTSVLLILRLVPGDQGETVIEYVIKVLKMLRDGSGGSTPSQ